VGVVHRDRDVTVGVAGLVLFHAPVVRQFEHGRFRFIAVADKGEGEFPVRIVITAEQPHAENPGVKAQRPIQIADPQHGMKNSHLCSPYRSGKVDARAFSSRRADR